MKSYTDLEQSKKLAEILPIESADMYYWCGEDLRIGGYRAMDIDYDIPCWSLAALLNVLPNGTDVVKEEADTENEKYMCTVLVNDSLVTTFANNPVDACVEMIKKKIETENVDNTNKIEPKFHEGEWLIANFSVE